jgi:hypothetical protein
MKKIILASVLSLVLLVVLGLDGKAEMAKEGTYSGTLVLSATYKALAMREERLQMNYEYMGVHTSDTAEGFLHNSSGHGIGALHAVKGVYEDSGFHVATDPDGDQAFYIWKGTGKVGGIGKGTVTWLGGTGKYSGLQGSAEYTVTPVRPAAEGTFQAVGKQKGHWKLP